LIVSNYKNMTKSTSSSGFFMKSVLSLSVWGQNSGRKVKERTFFYSPPGVYKKNPPEKEDLKYQLLESDALT